ncbi:C6 zinc finger domain protein [Apiospora arundinis]|uniref:C6 zinc finger domain protein n=1 Tax=Apiospora arundinis TaxID=335852 RepID=A0ABR2I3E0_9PEZI
MENIPPESESSQASPPRQTPWLRQRGRPILSCRECRRRKIRCDHKTPCAHCVRFQRRCTYQSFVEERTPQSVSTQPGLSDQGASVLQPDATKTPPHTTPTHSSQPLEQDSISHSAPVNSRAEVEQAGGIPTPADSLGRGSSAAHPAQDQETRSDGNNVLRRLRNIEEPAENISGTRSNRTHAIPPDIITQEWQVVSNKSRDQGKRRKVGTAQEFASIIACFSEISGRDCGIASFREPEVAQLVAQAADFLKQCKGIARELKARRPTRGLSFAQSGLVLPPHDTVDAMVNLYFAAFESTHRILHVPSFWKDYRAFWDNPKGGSDDLRLKVLLVMSIGSSLHDHGSADATLRNTELAHQCIYDAETWLGGPLKKDRIGITGLQISCLTILARQIFSIGGDTVWVTMGSLIHAAMQLGLHRDPKHLLLDIPCLEAEMRRRLWATILDLAVQAALDSAMPPRISMDDFDTEPPANINDDELHESTTVIQSHPQIVFTSTSVQIALLKALPVRLRIVQQMNSLHSKLTYQHALDLSAQLIESVRAAHSATGCFSGVTAFHRALLDYLVRRFMIPLHYSFSNQARTNPMYYYSLKLSTDTAIALVQQPEKDTSAAENEFNDESRVFFARLMALGGGLFRAGVRGAITALTLDLLTRVQEQRLDGTLAQHAAHRAPAKRAIQDLIALSDERIRLGETNVKGHMFLCMILAQVEAVEDGAPIEARIARAARDSLEYCLRLLRARKGETASSSADDGVGGGGGDVTMDDEGELGLGLGGYELDLDWDSLLPDMGFG